VSPLTQGRCSGHQPRGIAPPASGIRHPASGIRHPAWTADIRPRIFLVNCSNLRNARWVDAEPATLGEGDVRLRIDSMAPTLNNIPYAAFGAAMSYWSFLQPGADDTGCMPVRDFADIVAFRTIPITMPIVKTSMLCCARCSSLPS
jgi:hypothetical protein